MTIQEKVLNLVDQISSVELKAAFVSIELERAQELVQFLSSKNISAKLTQWNYPESLYIGNETALDNLIVLSLSW